MNEPRNPLVSPVDPRPSQVLTPRRKRAILSFRRKTDLVWFLLTVVLFAGGVSALFVVGRVLQGMSRPETETFVAESPPPDRFPTPPLPPPERPATTDVQQVTPPKQKFASRVVSREKTPTPSPARGRGFQLLREAGPFKTITNEGATVSIAPVKSIGEPAVQITYDLNGGEWVQCYVDLRENFSNYSMVQFLFYGEGASNTLEFKMVDNDGTNVGATWSHKTGLSAWTVVHLPLSDLTYLWGGDPVLDLRRIRQIYFAVSVKRGDEGGRGRVTIRGIKFL